MATIQTSEGLLSLHRYFIWANRMRTHFDELLQLENYAMAPQGQIESRLYMSYWYAGLYVVIEGWRELGLSDVPIDDLLNSPNVELLRRYRNGTFHFKRAYNDQRFMELLKDGTDVVAWVRELNQQFGRFFLALPRQPPEIRC
ncbi:MAG: hypothetical protein ACLQHK_05890 [Gallionellaceae bacterium]